MISNHVILNLLLFFCFIYLAIANAVTTRAAIMATTKPTIPNNKFIFVIFFYVIDIFCMRYIIYYNTKEEE